ncbi:hypothetical protein DFH11DRAFT_1502225 [Phellopilus nigrolimitatus]|nr:hypothetical protein DFH11DRAFT_1502225 [Phellopilus nigrolimitatus]
MPFRARNTFYLRVSATDVLPLYLYLDERHLDWMSERTLKSVVSDLRPLIGPKLEAEKYAHYGPGGPTNAKKGTVEVHRGENYQFAYFLRKADTHTVVLKVAPRPFQEDRPSAKGAKRPRQKRTLLKQQQSSGKKGKEKATESNADSEEELDESPLSDLEGDFGSDEQPSRGPLRRSSRKKTQTVSYQVDSDEDSNDNPGDTGREEDVDMQDEEDSNSPRIKQEETPDPVAILRDAAATRSDSLSGKKPDIGIDDDEDEEKMKPSLQLAFRELSMHDRCLCVVVEPWPAPHPTIEVRTSSATRAASATPSAREPSRLPSRFPSIAPSQFASRANEKERGETPLPLFLPDFDERDRSVTPAPVRFSSVFSSLNTMDDAQDTIEDDDGFGMLAFSQVLNNVSGDRASGAAEDDEIDGNVLYGDADETRNIIQ